MSTAEERAANAWWDSLGPGRRVQVHRWVAQRGTGPEEHDPEQLTIEDAIGDKP